MEEWSQHYIRQLLASLSLHEVYTLPKHFQNRHIEKFEFAMNVMCFACDAILFTNALADMALS